MISAVTRASSATGRSLVPAETIAIMPLAGTAVAGPHGVQQFTNLFTVHARCSLEESHGAASRRQPFRATDRRQKPLQMSLSRYGQSNDLRVDSIAGRVHGADWRARRRM